MLLTLLYVPEHDQTCGDVTRNHIKTSVVLEVVGEYPSDHGKVGRVVACRTTEDKTRQKGRALAEEVAASLPLGLDVVSAHAPSEALPWAGITQATALEKVEHADRRDELKDLAGEKKRQAERHKQILPTLNHGNSFGN